MRKMNALLSAATRFRRDETGSVALMFGASMIGIMLTAGMAIDYSRAAAARSDLQAALDSASLAAAKAMSEGETDTAKIKSVARSMFDANFGARLSDAVKTDAFTVTIDLATKSATVKASARMDNVFMAIAGIPDIDVGSASSSTADGDKAEIAMMVDMTGSMADKPKGGKTAKIASLTSAAADFVDTMLPASGANDTKVRIAVVPFSEGVNAGTYASTVTAGASNKCVVERAGAEANTDAAPSVAPLLAPVWINEKGIIRSVACPANAVRPLTNNRATLLSDIKAFSSTGYTAGHIGTQWARYVLSSKWNTVWPSSKAVAAGTKGTKKIAILMTDGLYNTSFDAQGKGKIVEPNSSSTDAALAACKAMDKEGTVVYTIGFDLNGASGTWAKDMLKECASTITDENGNTRKAFYDVSDDAGLKAAYQDIAARLLRIRVTS